MSPQRHPLIDGFSRALRPPDRRLPWEWCEEHVVVDDTSPLPGRWRSDNSPWVREVMEEATRRRRVVVKCAAQTAKTQTVLIITFGGPRPGVVGHLSLGGGGGAEMVGPMNYLETQSHLRLFGRRGTSS